MKINLGYVIFGCFLAGAVFVGDSSIGCTIRGSFVLGAALLIWFGVVTSIMWTNSQMKKDDISLLMKGNGLLLINCCLATSLFVLGFFGVCKP